MLDLFQFASGTYVRQSESRRGARMQYISWDTPDADLLFAWLELSPMEMDPGIATTDELESCFSRSQGESRRLIEFEAFRLCGLPTFRSIQAHPGTTSALTYAGQIVMPFGDRHARFTCQCRERADEVLQPEAWHPLSRVRRVLDHIMTTLEIDPVVRSWPRPPQPVFASLP